MAIQTFNNGESGNSVRTKINTNFTELDDRFKGTTINLVANTDYTQPNLHTTSGHIPNVVQLKASDGTLILDAYINVHQSTGVTTINVGSNYTNAIFTSIAW